MGCSTITGLRTWRGKRADTGQRIGLRWGLWGGVLVTSVCTGTALERHTAAAHVGSKGHSPKARESVEHGDSLTGAGWWPGGSCGRPIYIFPNFVLSVGEVYIFGDNILISLYLQGARENVIFIFYFINIYKIFLQIINYFVYFFI